MPFPTLHFVTNGSWEGTTLLNMGAPIDARAIYLKLKSITFAAGDGGGLSDGLVVTDARLVLPQPGLQEQIEELASQGDLDSAYGLCYDESLFPGSIEFSNGNTSFRVELLDPSNDAMSMRFFMEGIEITDAICEVQIVVDSIANEVYGWFSYVQSYNTFDFQVVNTQLF